jgi:hypothetical protein
MYWLQQKDIRMIIDGSAEVDTPRASVALTERSRGTSSTMFLDENSPIEWGMLN